MRYFYNFLIGILLGFGAILPGVSSGVICIIFGIYERLVDSILSIFKNFKNNIKFLLPIGLGSFLGIFILGNAIKYLFSNFHEACSYCFMGLILGTVPSLFRQANNNKKCISFKYIIYMLISFFIGVLLIVFENLYALSSTSISSNIYYLIFAGFIMSIGIIVPGVSNTVLLMLLGVYSIYLDAVSTLNLLILIPMAIGIALGSLIWLKLIQYLLKNYHSQTLFSITGFVLGSTLFLFPGFSLDFAHLLYIFIFVISILFSYRLSRI